MVKIPQAEPSVGFSPSGSVRTDGSEASRINQEAGKLNQTIENAEDMMVKVRDTQQINAASALVTQRLNDIKYRAANDPDIYSEQRYYDEIAKLGGEAAKTISGELARQQFNSVFDTAAISARHAIKLDFRQRQVQAAQADFLTNIETLKNAYCDSVYGSEKEAIAGQIRASIELNRQNGVLDAVEATKLWQTLQKDLPAMDAERAIAQDPRTALARLQNNAYPIQDPEKYADLVKDAQNAIIRQDKLAEKGLKIKQAQTGHDLMVEMLNGSLTKDRIKKEVEENNLNDADAKSFLHAIESVKTTDLQMVKESNKDEQDQRQAKTYLEMWDLVLSKGKAGDKRARLLKEYANGNLRREDLNRLYTGAIIPQAGGGKASLSDEVWAEDNPRISFFEAAGRAFRNFFGSMIPIIKDVDNEESEE